MERGVELMCDRCNRRFLPGDPLPRSQRNDLQSTDGAVETHSCLSHARLTFDCDSLFASPVAIAEKPDSIWEYLPLLPVAGTKPVTLGEGGTDCITAERLGDELGIDLRLKLEGQQPSGSTKDRGSAVLATYAREHGHETIACASTGNAAASIAAYAARAGLGCRLFVPENTPQTKAVQPEIYGATVTRVPGSYGDAYEACAETVAAEGWLDRSAGASPFTAAGAATLGLELAGQCPTADWVVIPMGNGGTLAGAWIGLHLASQLATSETAPRLLGVQTQAATTIHDAFQTRDSTTLNDQDSQNTGPASFETCADSIAVREPHRLREACQALTESEGTTVLVPEDDIFESIHRLGQTEGLFAEPASAAVIAGIQQARERAIIDASETVVGVITGSGLKDAATAQAALEYAKKP